jgi:site-specific recombinase XerD
VEKNKTENLHYDVSEGALGSNKEIFKRYQKEVNMGKTQHAKDLDRRIMRVFLKHVRKNFGDITKDDVVEFFDGLTSGRIHSARGKPYGSYTMEFFKTQLHKFFKWYTNSKTPEQTFWIQPNLKRAYKHKTRSDVLDAKEVQKLIDVSRTIKEKAIVAVLFDSAARVSEFTGLNIGNIVEEGDEILVTIDAKDGDAKTGERIIPLNFSVKYLKEYLSGHPRKNDRDAPLWLSIYGNRMKPSRMQQLLHKLQKDAEIQKNVSPHILRHSRLTILANEGMNETHMRYFAGWRKDSTMPSVYLHINSSDVRETIQKIERKEKYYTEEEVQKEVESRMDELENKIMTKMKEWLKTPGEVVWDYNEIKNTIPL